jgi:hypothetical protein
MNDVIIFVHTYTHTHTHTHTYIHTYIHIYIHIHMCLHNLIHNCQLIVLGLNNLPEIFLHPKPGFDSLYPTWNCFVEETFRLCLDAEVAIQAHVTFSNLFNFSLCAKIRNDRLQNLIVVIYIRVLNLDLFNDARYTLHYARCIMYLVPEHERSWGNTLHMQSFYAIKQNHDKDKMIADLWIGNFVQYSSTWIIWGNMSLCTWWAWRRQWNSNSAYI